MHLQALHEGVIKGGEKVGWKGGASLFRRGNGEGMRGGGGKYVLSGKSQMCDVSNAIVKKSF